jgi:hypothetical protein
MRWDIMKTIILTMFAILAIAQAVNADAWLVTISYDSGKYDIKHVEMISGTASHFFNDGEMILGYENATAVLVATTFNMPIVSSQGTHVEQLNYAEYTVSIPAKSGYGDLSIFNMSGNRLATFSLSGISEVGDAKGTPPKGSLAEQTGEVSVAKALEKSEGAATTTGTTNVTGTNVTGKEGENQMTATPSGFKLPCISGFAIAAIGVSAYFARRSSRTC